MKVVGVGDVVCCAAKITQKPLPHKKKRNIVQIFLEMYIITQVVWKDNGRGNGELLVNVDALDVNVELNYLLFVSLSLVIIVFFVFFLP